MVNLVFKLQLQKTNILTQDTWMQVVSTLACDSNLDYVISYHFSDIKLKYQLLCHGTAVGTKIELIVNRTITCYPFQLVTVT